MRRIVDWVCENWDQPDEGIWETRGGRKNFMYSRLMCWVALRARDPHGQPTAACPPTCVALEAERDAIYRQIMQQGLVSRSARRSSSTTTPTCSTPRC